MTAQDTGDKSAPKGKPVNIMAAAMMIRGRIQELDAQMKATTPDSPEFNKLKEEMTSLFKSIGLDFNPFSAEETNARLKAAEKTKEEASSEPKGETPSPKTSWWSKVKTFCRDNQTAIMTTAAAVIATGLAAYLYLRKGSISTTITVDAPAASMHHADGDAATTWTKLGDWLASGWVFIKTNAIKAKDWIIGLFTKPASPDAAVPNGA